MHLFGSPVRSAAVLVTVALALVLAGTAIGATLQKNGGPVTAVRTATADDYVYVQVANSPTMSWANVPGMSVSANVPSGEKGLLVITFSAVSQCNGTSGGFCHIRVLVDGTQANPGAVTFDSADDGPGGSVNSYETNSMQFIAGPKSAGAHTVTVQWAMSPYTNGTFTLLGRTLTVLRSKA